MCIRTITAFVAVPAVLSAQVSPGTARPKPTLAIGAQTSASVGADVRLIQERYRSEDFGRTSLALDHSLMQRYMAHVDVRVVSRSRRMTARAYAQLKSGLVSGRAAGVRIPDVDTLDVQQALVELAFAATSGESVALRLGRQELAYGNQRLLGLRDFPNVRQSFDVARLMLHGGAARPWNVDVFGGAPVSTRVGMFDDATDRSKLLWGVYATRTWSAAPGNLMDLYYVGHHRDHAATHAATGVETRHTLGMRAFARRQVMHGVMDVEVEPMLQVGRLASEAVRAWSVSAVSGWRWSRVPTTPRVSLGVDASSGDNGAASRTRGSYHPLYATGGHMALGSPLGAVNFVSLHPKLEASFTRKLTLAGDWFIAWRESTRDGLYNIAGAPIAAPAATEDRRERLIGHRPGIHVDYALNSHTSVGARATRYLAGPYLRAIGWNNHTEYAAVTATFRF